MGEFRFFKGNQIPLLLGENPASYGAEANAWLMAQLETNRPLLFRAKESLALGRFMDEVGRKINAIARDFNSGYGTAEQLRFAVRRLGEVYEQIHALRKKGYPHAE